jgi:hypothetical protein
LKLFEAGRVEPRTHPFVHISLTVLVLIAHFLFRQREEAMETIKTILVASIGAFLIGAASAPTQLALSRNVIDSTVKSSNQRASDAALDRADSAHSDPDAPAEHSPLGIAMINGRRIAIYNFQYGANLNEAATQGRGYADVFDSAGHLKRRFIFRENLNSSPRIMEFIYLPEH